jgi:TRAP-type transport system periplasmic protein
MKLTISTTLAGLAMAGMMIGVTPSYAKSMTVSSGFPPIAVPPKAHKAVADWLAKNSDIKLQVFAMTLLSLQETSAGIRDGVVDMGYVLTPYFSAEYAETNLAADMSLLSTAGTPTKAPGLVMAAAITEYVMLNCTECQAQYKAQNQLWLAGGSSTEYSLACREPISGPDKLRGKSIRVGAPVFGRWVEFLGGTQANFPGSEQYEALSQGVVACTMVGTPDVVNFQLQDVVKDIQMGVPGGVFAGAGSLNLNLNTWKGLTPEQRKVMLQAGALSTAETAVGYVRQAVTAEVKAKESGVALTPASEAFKAKTAEFIAGDMKTIETQFTTAYRLQNVSAKMETIKGLVEKWKAKVNLIDPSDSEAYRKLLWDEIYAKVDADTYGMN